MRTPEDLKLAAAILRLNIHANKATDRIVSSIGVYRLWHSTPIDEFQSVLAASTKKPNLTVLARLLARIEDLRLTRQSEELLFRLNNMSEAEFFGFVRTRSFKQMVNDSITLPPGIFGVLRRSSIDRYSPELESTRPLVMSEIQSGLPKPVSKIHSAPFTSQGFGVTAPKATTYSIFFGTDRNHTNIQSKTLFGDERNEAGITYGVSEVSIPDVHKEGNIERPAKKFRLFPTAENPSLHIVIHKVTALSLQSWIESAEMNESDGLLFIHGFNVTFDEALWRTSQLCHDLKFSGRQLCYSWASCGRVLSYPTDEATIDWSVAHLREFLHTVTRNLGLRKLHIIAHSMGNRALLAVLESWQTADGETPISQIVLAAPDVDTGRFKQIAKVFGHYDQVTLYASRDDRAIKVSRAVKALPRAGDANPPIVMTGLSTVDVTAVAGELFGLGHSYIAATSPVFRDLYYIIQEGLSPEKRAGIRKCDDGYYILN
ncbi:alpha/beta fold hydrolase [Pseudomonas entomophila]|uniref:alpha/beta hydrolase n=1 Tax=Pseudomonas entomophila TaxID=312306 RepID=UPI0015E2CBC2|nr:alpha/beta fold hydrolase [Pseudomonas entomophila]MBA1190844.1 alpha/beta fold hydrolase [Pseudomonas entomophila]